MPPTNIRIWWPSLPLLPFALVADSVVKRAQAAAGVETRRGSCHLHGDMDSVLKAPHGFSTLLSRGLLSLGLLTVMLNKQSAVEVLATAASIALFTQ